MKLHCALRSFPVALFLFAFLPVATSHAQTAKPKRPKAAPAPEPKDPTDLKPVAVDAFFTDWRWLEQRRRQNGTHIPPYYIAPYYFFYAHRFVAQAIELLPEDKRPEYRKKLYELLWHVREEDGGWNDRVFPRSENFGTAMTMFALLEPHARRPAGWADVKTATPAGAGKPAGPDKPAGPEKKSEKKDSK
jgi:hypothetical protein